MSTDQPDRAPNIRVDHSPLTDAETAVVEEFLAGRADAKRLAETADEEFLAGRADAKRLAETADEEFLAGYYSGWATATGELGCRLEAVRQPMPPANVHPVRPVSTTSTDRPITVRKTGHTWTWRCDGCWVGLDLTSQRSALAEAQKHLRESHWLDASEPRVTQ